VSSTGLTPLSCVVLAVVGRGGATTPEIVDMAARGAPFFWTSAESQVYAEPKRLLELGYLRASKTQGITRSRTRYELTEAGHEALRDSLAQPAGFPRIQHEASVRLLAGDLIGDDVIVSSLEGLGTEIASLEEKLAALEERALLFPHRAKYLALQLRLARRLLDAHREWVREVSEELAPDGDAPGRAVR
jgi:DNA-binding PadR family transcriptional regulator